MLGEAEGTSKYSALSVKRSDFKSCISLQFACDPHFLINITFSQEKKKEKEQEPGKLLLNLF